MVHRGRPMSRSPTEKEIAALVALDEAFFARRMTFPDGEHRLVDQCQYFSEAGGHRFLSWARRIIVPDAVLKEATNAVRPEHPNVAVIPASQVLAAA